jgi:hypothetical protein
MSIDFFIFARFFISDQRLGLAREQCRGGKCPLLREPDPRVARNAL